MAVTIPKPQPLAEADASTPKTKFQVYGEEMVMKTVKVSGNSGRVYLPPEWVSKTVKIIRID
jgi:putative transposon-encoded protein